MLFIHYSKLMDLNIINQQTIMLNSKLKTLEKRKNYAWSQYFKAHTDAHSRELQHSRNMISVLSRIKRHNDELPKFLVDEITQLLVQSKKQIECPVCYLPISDSNNGDDDIEYAKGNLVITWCGHKLCRSCYSNSAMKACPSCRTSFTKK